MRIVYFIGFCFLLVTCSQVEFDSDYIDVDASEIATIETRLDIIDFQTDMEDFLNFYEKGNSGELLAVRMDVYDADKNKILSDLGAQIKIRGVGSSLYDLKSFEVKLDEDYFQGDYHFVLDHPVGTANNLDTISNFRLRNSGQDFFDSFLKDKAYTKLAVQLGLDFESMYGTQTYQIFINGSYHGMLNARSESNLEGISKLRGVSANEMVLYKVNRSNQNMEYHQGNKDITVDLEEAIDDYLPEELYALIDISSFIDYVVYEDYIGNFDWPDRNIRMYSENGQPFRFILYDLDLAAYQTKEVYLPRMEYQNFDLAKLYQKLRMVDGFDERLKNRRKEIYAGASPGMFNEIVDAFAAQIADEIHFQIAKYQAPENYYYWMVAIEKLKLNFASRDQYIRKYYDL